MTNTTASSETCSQPAPPLPLTLYAKPRRSFLYLAICFGFLVAFVYMIVDPWANDPNPRISFAMAILGIALFGTGTVWFLYMLIRKPRLVKLDKEGVLISGQRCQIYWKDITDFRVVRESIGSGDIVWIAVFVGDTSGYYSSWGPINRWLLSLTENKFGTPVLINCDFFRIDPDTLVEWLNEYRERYSHRGTPA